ncbi:hypothetical protein NMG60_11017097 [Bertholletia excelsa]
MQSLYSKLYDKYTKLKTKRYSEIDKINRDQEVKFINYVSAADELIEHLRNENDRLRTQINDLRSEVASVRSAKDEQHAEFQMLLVQENEKNKNLSEEIERLQNLQNGGLCCSGREDKTEYESLNMPANDQDSDSFNAIDASVPRKRSRQCGSVAEVMVTVCASDKLECAPVGESASNISKQVLSTGTGLITDQPECCRRIVDLSGGVSNSSPTKCIYKDLMECLIGMELSAIIQTGGICISAVHQSSGYSFSLTWIKKAGEEVDVVYRVISLGTFERVAPEWMREVVMFSMNMCPVFFERVSRVIKLHQ